MFTAVFPLLAQFINEQIFPSFLAPYNAASFLAAPLLVSVGSSASFLVAGVTIYESTSLFSLLAFHSSGVIIYESIR